jgi:hypothetical protein
MFVDQCINLASGNNPSNAILLREKVFDGNHRYSFNGRMTRTMTSDKPGCFLKVSWPWSNQTAEAKTIATARERAGSDRRILDHLPTVLGYLDSDQYSTKHIRVLLGLEHLAFRKLQIVAFKQLIPITDLKGDEFWQAFWEIARCASFFD